MKIEKMYAILLSLSCVPIVAYFRGLRGVAKLNPLPPTRLVQREVIAADTHGVKETDEPLLRPLLVLFTTFSTIENVSLSINNTLHTWATMGDWLKPVLYSTDRLNTSQARLATSLGWSLNACPQTVDTRTPTCVLPAMFLHAQRQYPHADFYAYANGDILFDESLQETLNAISAFKVKTKRYIMVGKRSNYQMKPGELIRNTSQVGKLFSKAQLFTGWAGDFFITPAHVYPWNDTLPLGVGRGAVDNYMVASSIKKGIPVIDGTRTIRAMHQTQRGHTNYMGMGSSGRRRDGSINFRIIGKTNSQHKFQFNLGRIECSQFMTIKDSGGAVRVVRQEKNPCSNHYEKEHVDLPPEDITFS